MITNINKKMIPNKILVKDLNPCLTCSLCQGYFIDATSLVDCLHVFCRACILRYFENFKLACPTCNVAYKKRSNPCFRPDLVTQALVFKLIPGLYSREVQRREDFYRSTGVRASSSCSEDSVLGDLNEDNDDWVLSSCGDDYQNQYFSPDDVISLSLEYYKPYLDKTQNVNKSTNNVSDKNNSAEKISKCDDDNNKISDDKLKSASDGNADDVKVEGGDSGDSFCSKKDADRRYLRCPAAVTMSHLQKFLRMKYALSVEHRVDIIYLGEVLAAHFSLMDVAYTFKWKRTKPMRFFFRIFTPAKIQPIKIINTSSMGGKQLQVVLSKTSTLNFPNQQSVDTKPSVDLIKRELDDQNDRNKERLMANLQLQSKAKLLEKNNVKNHKASHSSDQNGTSEKSYRLERLKPVRLTGALPEDGNCVYEYEEPDKDEIRAFAEKRDREWALQKQLDEEKEKHRNGKKRKKSKHSKNNLLYKKRKLHAEITSNDSLEKEESLKLKVKITPHNGYKHKHHKSSQSHSVDAQAKSELSSKEKLLQMRQVRHKNILGDDKSKSLPQNNNSPPPPVAVVEEKSKEEPKVVKQEKIEAKPLDPPPKPVEIVVPLKSVQTPPAKPLVKESSPGKTLRSDFSNKTNAAKEVPKIPRVQLERNEQTERHTQKTFLKTFQSYTENYSRETSAPSFKARPVAPNTYSGRNHLQTTRALEQKIASLHQQSTTIEAKPPPPLDVKVPKKAVVSTSEKPHILNSQYASGFTVSKVEIGVKRRLENDQQLQDKFPSLEITLINPPAEKPPEVKPIAKRPPPATIPLEKIKKSINRVSGVSIIPKVVDKCDNNGALDLTKPNRLPDALKTHEVQNHILNGKSFLTSKLLEKPTEKNILSNLQMLSKVATEHPNINKNSPVATATTTTTTTPKRPQMPSLQTLKVPLPHQASNKSNLAKLPKLNEINKTQFRLPSPQLKNMRPNQNQSIRNIPNPSLLVRQQNQNRLNCMTGSSGSGSVSSSSATQNSSAESKEQKVVESGEKNVNNVGEKK